MGELDTSNTALAESALCPAGMPIARQAQGEHIKGVVARARLMSQTLDGIGDVFSRRKALEEVLGYGRAVPFSNENAFVARLESVKSESEYVSILEEAARL